MIQLPDHTPLGTARKFVDLRRRDGVSCPCCGQLAKEYKRKLSAVPAAAMCVLYTVAGDDWAHISSVASRLGGRVAHQGGYLTIPWYWGIIEEEKQRRPDGGRAGWWRLTKKGTMWVKGDLRLFSHAWTFDGKFLRFDGKLITIHEALEEQFDYQELMHP